MAVDLANTQNRMMDFNLDHPACHEAGYGRVVRMTVLDYEVGDATPKPRTKVQRIPGALTFLAKEVKVNLPNAVLFAPEVASALKSGVLVLKRQVDDGPVAQNEEEKQTSFSLIDQAPVKNLGFTDSTADSNQPPRVSNKKGRD